MLPANNDSDACEFAKSYVENTFDLCFPNTLVQSITTSMVSVCQLSGLALLGVGVWMLVDPDIVDDTDVWADVANSELLRIAAIVLIVVGSLLFIISLMGIIGAVIEHKVILGIVRTLFYVDARFRFPERCKFQRCADRCPGFGSESESESPF